MLWNDWWNLVCELRSACARTRTFLWMALCLAGFAARKDLAKELGYTGDSNDSASMNIWLHKQVMVKLAANGGKLPPEIKH